jgi:hypothetical protein
MTTRIVPPLLTAAAVAATVAVPVHAAGIPKTNKCGTVATKNGGKAQYIRAYKIGCKSAKAIVRHASGKKTFKANRFTCRMTGPTYLCSKPKSKSTIVFMYKKPR